MPTGEADRYGIRPNDRLTIRFDRSTQVELPVAGIYASSEVLDGVVVDVAAVPKRFREYVRAAYATGPDPTAARTALEAAFRDRPDVLVTGREAVTARLLDTVGLVFTVLYALLGVALLTAALGVVNTLALSVWERTREIGMLRTLGASRGLVRRAVRGESLVISLYGGLLGIAVGIAVGAVLQRVIFNRPLTGLVVPYPVVGVALVGMVLVAVAAAAWPARRAANTDVLAALDER